MPGSPVFAFPTAAFAVAFSCFAALCAAAAPARADVSGAIKVISAACLANIGNLAGLDALAVERNWVKSEESAGAFHKDFATTSMWDAEQDGEKLRIVAGVGHFDDGDAANLCTVIFDRPKTGGIALHREIEETLGLKPVAGMKLPLGRIGLYRVKAGQNFGLTLQILWMNDGTPVQASIIGPRWRSA